MGCNPPKYGTYGILTHENDHLVTKQNMVAYITKQHIEFLQRLLCNKELNPHEKKHLISVPVILSSRKTPIRITMENNHQIPL